MRPILTIYRSDKIEFDKENTGHNFRVMEEVHSGLEKIMASG